MDLVWENYAYLIYCDEDVYYVYNKDLLESDGWKRSLCFCGDSYDECRSFITDHECD